MSCMQEDDLIQVFKALGIQLLNLNHNVVKAWFDTDDNDMKNLLNWMCVSLSKKNYISPLELDEYSELPNPCYDDDLKKEKALIEEKYPGIFDSEYNELEIEFLEEELNLLRLNEKELDQHILLNGNLEGKLNNDLLNKNKEELEVSVKSKSTQNKCHKASEKLDALNKEIHEQWIKCTKILHNFEFSHTPTFINNFKITMYQEKLNNTISLLKPALDKSSDRNLTVLANATSLSSIPFDESIANHVHHMRHRIVCSRNKYLATTVEVEKLKALLFYLENISIEKLVSSSDNLLDQNISISLKMETRNRLCEMLEDTINTYADHQINLTQVKHMEQELKMQQENLHELTELENIIQHLLSHYSVLGLLFDVEKKDIEKYESFFKQVNTYISRDMESCVIRTERMKEIIQQYQNNATDDKLKLTKMIIKSLSNDEENFTISRAYELISNFKREMDYFETKLFSPGFSEIKAKEKELRQSINILQSFLISGPTHRVLLLPSELQIVIRQVEELLKKELQSVKSSMEIVSEMKKTPNKWQNYRRQLWMYFYSDPNGLNFILQQIQKEFESSKNNKT